MNRKVTVVGAGNVGATVAQRLAEKELCDVALVDILEGVPQGKALDLMQAAPIEGHDTRIWGSNSFDISSGSDVVILTAGIPRKPGMSRNDLLSINRGIVRDVTQQVVQHSPQAIIIVVSNPLDAMCHTAYEASGFPASRIVGMAGILDSARLRTFIAMELKVSMQSVQALVLGGHGDTMVPLMRYATAGGIPITELLPPEKIDALIKRTRYGGLEIVELLKTGSAYYAPASAAVEMAEAILHNRGKILPCAAYLSGQYGIHDLFVGVPVILGSGGVERIIEMDLTDDEMSELQKSAAAVHELVEMMKSLP